MLSDDQRKALDFEAAHGWWRYPGAHETAVRETLGWNMTRHWQLVTTALNDAEAEREWPALVHRLRRVVERRRGARTTNEVRRAPSRS